LKTMARLRAWVDWLKSRCRLGQGKSLTFFIFFLLGCGPMLPYNAFISGADYFEGLYPCQHVQFYFSTTYMITLLLGMAIILKVGERFSYSVRIVPGFAMFFVSLMASLPAENKNVHIFLVFITGVGDALVQAAVYGLVARFPQRYMAAVMTGNGAAGLLVSFVRLVTKAAVSSARASFTIYFCISSLFVFVCTIAWFVLLRLPYAQRCMQRSGDDEDTGLELAPQPEGAGERDTGEANADTVDDTFLEKEDGGAIQRGRGAHDVETSLEDDEQQDGAMLGPNSDFRSRLLAMRGMIQPGLCVAFNFFVTLALFPGVLAEMRPSDKNNDYFTVNLVFTFNLFDFIGRSLPRWQRCRYRWPHFLWIPASSRIVFFPLFLARALPSGTHSDLFAYLVVMAFAATNGYVGTTSMMLGPKDVPRPLQELAGTTMARPPLHHASI